MLDKLALQAQLRNVDDAMDRLQAKLDALKSEEQQDADKQRDQRLAAYAVATEQNSVAAYIKKMGGMCDRSGYEFLFVSRKNFEAWLALLNPEHTFLPDVFSARIKLFGKLSTGASYSFEAYAMQVYSLDKVFYGRNDKWNCVRVSMKDFHFTGENARSEATRAEAQSLFDLLV